MSVTINSRSIIFTAVNDSYDKPVLVSSLFLSGTGMTAGQRLTITDNDGDIIADHYVEDTHENVELCPNEMWFPGLKLTAVPAAGTWTVVAKIK